MNLFPPIFALTANLIGISTDPFEFQGDYGSDVNLIRQNVFDSVVSPERLALNLTCLEVQQFMATEDPGQDWLTYQKILVDQAIKNEEHYGPTLSQLVTPEISNELTKKQQKLNESGFAKDDLENIFQFLAKYSEQKVFRFLRNNPPELLNLDKTLRDKAAREGCGFNLPILGSTMLLAEDPHESKINLLDALFTKETFEQTKPQVLIKQALTKLDTDYLKSFFGPSADTKELEIFSSPAGQVFFFWLYQALNLDLVSVKPDMVNQINKVKTLFAGTLGDPAIKANKLKEKLIQADCGVLFTQESDALVPLTLAEEGLFYPVNHQNSHDGTFVLLRKDIWEADYKILSLEGYEGFKSGKVNLILAKRKDSGEEYLLASCHGHSTRPEDGRLQISLIMEKYHQLAIKDLQLIIGIDANTKTLEQVDLFKAHLDRLGLTCTQTGATTVKRRMVTPQNLKSGVRAVDTEDFLIILKPENGGKNVFSQVTVGFKEKVDITQFLPNNENPSDHYPVGATLISASRV